jgi:outer membrane biosynthesis protein TonB
MLTRYIADASNRQADDLLDKISAAVAAANEAEQTVTTAQTELVSRSKTVGLLLLEAKKLHPKVEDFEAFLKRIDGLKLARAYDCMRIAGGRTTDEEIRKATRERVKKHRTKKKLPKPAPAPKADPKPDPKPDPVSVTPPDVTETAEASADKRKAENANLSWSPEEMSAHNLSEFQVACRTYLPNLIEADLKKARVFFMEGAWKPRAKRQEAA